MFVSEKIRRWFALGKPQEKKNISVLLYDATDRGPWLSMGYSIRSDGTHRVKWKNGFPIDSMEELGFDIIWQDGKRPTLKLSFFGAADYTCSPVELTVADQFIERSREFALEIKANEVLCREILEKGLPKELTLSEPSIFLMRFTETEQGQPKKLILSKHGILLIDGTPYVCASTDLSGTKSYDYVCATTEKFEKIRSVWETLKQGTPFPYRIENFNYNGFMGKTLPGFAPYTATFVEWTKDPGVAKMHCSDGKDRLIPTFALETALFLPKAERKETVMFGAPASSN